MLTTEQTPQQTNHNNNNATLTAPQTPSTMLVVLDDAATFTDIVKARTRQRREKEDSAIATIRVQTKRLEAALTAEIKRRADAIQQFHQKANSEIKRVEETLQQQISHDRAVTEERLNLLEERLALLECKWQSDVNKTQQDFIRTAHQLQDQVVELKEQSQHERQARLEREASLNQQIAQLNNEYKELWQTERQERFAAVEKLTEKSVTDDMNRVEKERSLEQQIRQELNKLQREIQEEKETREKAVNEFSTVLHRYMENVQTNLMYMSAV
jgi:hypothetical protein